VVVKTITSDAFVFEKAGRSPSRRRLIHGAGEGDRPQFVCLPITEPKREKYD
jgi:hypothetical protein